MHKETCSLLAWMKRNQRNHAVPGNAELPAMVTALVPEGGPRDVTRESSNVADVGTARLYRSRVQTPAGRRVSPGESRECSNNRPEDERGCAKKAEASGAERHRAHNPCDVNPSWLTGAWKCRPLG